MAKRVESELIVYDRELIAIVQVSELGSHFIWLHGERSKFVVGWVNFEHRFASLFWDFDDGRIKTKSVTMDSDGFSKLGWLQIKNLGIIFFGVKIQFDHKFIVVSFLLFECFTARPEQTQRPRSLKICNASNLL